MNIPPEISANAETLRAIRRDLHAHPELGFQEVRTSGIVADKLREYGVDEVHTGLGGTGVVAIIKGNQSGERRIGLRADMDALPIHETTNLPYASQTPGVMHACGHDGHTTILLGAAQYLAATRNFAGTAILIFQPAEEGLGGARRMISDGLFEQFPCDEIYGLHNAPTLDKNLIAVTPGAAMAGASFFDITLTGTGSHAAQPHQSRDVIVAATHLVTTLQTIAARNVQPTQPIVVSVTQINAGSAYNVIPQTATLAGTIRYFSDETCDIAHQRLDEICIGVAQTFGIEVDVKTRNVFNVLENDPALSAAYISTAQEIVGNDLARISENQVTGSEDFADMLRVVPGAYCVIGHDGDVPVHSPEFVFDDEILPLGASLMARIVERRSQVTHG